MSQCEAREVLFLAANKARDERLEDNTLGCSSCDFLRRPTYVTIGSVGRSEADVGVVLSFDSGRAAQAWLTFEATLNRIGSSRLHLIRQKTRFRLQQEVAAQPFAIVRLNPTRTSPRRHHLKMHFLKRLRSSAFVSSVPNFSKRLKNSNVPTCVVERRRKTEST